MRDFLLTESAIAFPDLNIARGDVHYTEDINPDALTDAWLDRGTSYIWKVGALSITDSNKCDWIYVAFGVQRGEHSRPELKGAMYFDDGENDDPGRVIRRAIECLSWQHPVFDKDL